MASTAISAVQVGTVAAQIVAAAGSRGLGGKRYVRLINNGPNPIAIGTSSGVTMANGYIIPAGQSLELTRDGATALYAICSVTQVTPADTRLLVSK